MGASVLCESEVEIAHGLVQLMLWGQRRVSRSLARRRARLVIEKLVSTLTNGVNSGAPLAVPPRRLRRATRLASPSAKGDRSAVTGGRGARHTCLAALGGESTWIDLWVPLGNRQAVKQRWSSAWVVDSGRSLSAGARS